MTIGARAMVWYMSSLISGGLIGRVAKVVDDKELLVEVGENVKVRVLRQGVSDVRAKGEPAKAESK